VKAPQVILSLCLQLQTVPVRSSYKEQPTLFVSQASHNPKRLAGQPRAKSEALSAAVVIVKTGRARVYVVTPAKSTGLAVRTSRRAPIASIICEGFGIAHAASAAHQERRLVVAGRRRSVSGSARSPAAL